MVQVPVPEQAPDQPVNEFPVMADALKVTVVPLSKVAEQVEGQLSPAGELETVPLPATLAVISSLSVPEWLLLTDEQPAHTSMEKTTPQRRLAQVRIRDTGAPSSVAFDAELLVACCTVRLCRTVHVEAVASLMSKKRERR